MNDRVYLPVRKSPRAGADDFETELLQRSEAATCERLGAPHSGIEPPSTK